MFIKTRCILKIYKYSSIVSCALSSKNIVTKEQKKKHTLIKKKNIYIFYYYLVFIIFIILLFQLVWSICILLPAAQSEII